MPDTPDIYSLMRSHKQDVNDADADALKEQTDAFQGVIKAIQKALTDLLDQRNVAEANGEDVSVSWLFRRDRLAALLDQAKAAIDSYGDKAATDIAGYQQNAAAMAQAHALEAVVAQFTDRNEKARVSATWNRLPVGALTHLIGALGDGTPLGARLAQLAPSAVPQIRAAIVQGVATGKSPKAIAKAVSDAATVARDDALRIVRTETLRAYRESARVTYEANDDIVEGWVWVASFSVRTCAVCLVMNGTIHPINEPMASHICCRCVPSPIVKGANRTYRSGDDWLQAQSPERQDVILGKAAGTAYRDGTVSLADFAGMRESKEWGRSVYVRSLKSAKQAAQRRIGANP